MDAARVTVDEDIVQAAGWQGGFSHFTNTLCEQRKAQTCQTTRRLLRLRPSLSQPQKHLRRASHRVPHHRPKAAEAAKPCDVGAFFSSRRFWGLTDTEKARLSERGLERSATTRRSPGPCDVSTLAGHASRVPVGSFSRTWTL